MSEAFLKGSPTLYSVTMAAVFISMYLIGSCRKDRKPAWKVLQDDEIEELQIKIEGLREAQSQSAEEISFKSKQRSRTKFSQSEASASPVNEERNRVSESDSASAVLHNSSSLSRNDSNLQQGNSRMHNCSHNVFDKSSICSPGSTSAYRQSVVEDGENMERELLEAAERLHQVNFALKDNFEQWEAEELDVVSPSKANIICYPEDSNDDSSLRQAYSDVSDDASELSQEANYGEYFNSAEAAADAIITYKRALMQKVAHLRTPNNNWAPQIAEQRELQLKKLGAMLNLRHPIERIPFVLQYYRDSFECVREDPLNSEFVERLANYYFALCMVRANRVHPVDGATTEESEEGCDEENAAQEISCADLINVAPKEIETHASWSTPLLELLREAFDFCLRSPSNLHYVEKRLAEAARMYFRALIFRLRHLEGVEPYCRGSCDGIRSEMLRVEGALGKIENLTGSGYAAGAA